ncbi:MAG: Dna2/Cas4 domain-containing protein [Crenarchaeota archaeon]|nr:Dna2/Cas4 domain-containing protein [Thermoproteota archaeon]
MRALRAADPWFDFSEWRKVVDSVRRSVESKQTSELIDIVRKSDKYEVVRAGKLIEIRDTELGWLRHGWVYPSLVNLYRRCARQLYIEVSRITDGKPLLVTRPQLEAMVRGILVHEEWRKRFAIGETEVELVSEALKVRGVADEVARSVGLVVEVKSGYGFDDVAVAVQAKLYAIMAEEMGLMDAVAARVVSPRGVFEPALRSDLAASYVQRVRIVIEDALNNREPPPRLSPSVRSRCETCPYRLKDCATLKSAGTIFDWLESRGFQVRRPQRTLLSYTSSSS